MEKPRLYTGITMAAVVAFGGLKIIRYFQPEARPERSQMSKEQMELRREAAWSDHTQENIHVPADLEASLAAGARTKYLEPETEQ